MRVLAAQLGVDAIGFADLQIVASFMPGGGTSSMLSVSVIDGGTATIEAYFVPPLLKRGGFAGYAALKADPVGKIGQVTEATLHELPPAAATRRTPEESDEGVVADVESLLKK